MNDQMGGLLPLAIFGAAAAKFGGENFDFGRAMQGMMESARARQKAEMEQLQLQLQLRRYALDEKLKLFDFSRAQISAQREDDKHGRTEKLRALFTDDDPTNDPQRGLKTRMLFAGTSLDYDKAFRPRVIRDRVQGGTTQQGYYDADTGEWTTLASGSRWKPAAPDKGFDLSEYSPYKNEDIGHVAAHAQRLVNAGKPLSTDLLSFLKQANQFRQTVKVGVGGAVHPGPDPNLQALTNPGAAISHAVPGGQDLVPQPPTQIAPQEPAGPADRTANVVTLPGGGFVAQAPTGAQRVTATTMRNMLDDAFEATVEAATLLKRGADTGGKGWLKSKLGGGVRQMGIDVDTDSERLDHALNKLAALLTPFYVMEDRFTESERRMVKELVGNLDVLKDDESLWLRLDDVVKTLQRASDRLGD